jgi:hypothetical protein
MDLNTVYLIIGIGAAGVVVIGFLVKKVWPGLRALFRLLDQLTDVPENNRLARSAEPGLFEILANQNEDLRVIRKQLFKNGGGSLKDDVDMLKSDVKELTSKIDNSLAASAPAATTTINVNPGGTS